MGNDDIIEEVRNPTMKNRAVATVIARVSVSIGALAMGIAECEVPRRGAK
jgi:hypothetical protein